MAAFDQLRSEIENFEVFDTHEHIEREASRLSNKNDIFSVFFKDYSSSDLVSAGMPRESLERLKCAELDLERKWVLCKPYWSKCSNTGHSRVILRAMRDLYGIDRLGDDTYQRLNDQIERATRPGLYKKILQSKCKIQRSVLDMMGEPYGKETTVHNTYLERLSRVETVEKELFWLSIRFDDFIWLVDSTFITELEKYRNIELPTIETWAGQLGFELEEYKRRGIAAIKIGLAYDRSLNFEKTDRKTAARLFKQVKRTRIPNGWQETRALQDYMMHTLLEYASQLGLVVQVHTGLQEGNGNIISNANPVHLANAFLLYPNVRFDVFHGGYPYCLELAAIAKNFPNVYVDLCWLSMISPHYSEWYLSELLDTVPSNKILGFGGDAGSVEVAYGALAVAKDVLSVALAEKVDSGALNMEQSLEIAGMLLCDNAKSMFLGGNA